MSKPKLAVFDADGLIFYAGWEFKDQLNMVSKIAAKKKLDKIITNILKRVDAEYYIGFYSAEGVKNFRHDIATIAPYKGNRAAEPWQLYFKPVLKNNFEDKWGFHPVGDLEADDCVVIAHHLYKDDYDVIHIGEDKDMKQVGEFTRMNPSRRSNPGQHIEEFDQETGRKFFWQQMCMGDSTDNIKGIAGVGKKNKMITTIDEMENPSEEEMFEFVKQGYINKYGNSALDIMAENYILLRMFDKPCWDYPMDSEPILWKEKDAKTPMKLLDI
jgi:5'-3' exonuclease